MEQSQNQLAQWASDACPSRKEHHKQLGTFRDPLSKCWMGGNTTTAISTTFSRFVDSSLFKMDQATDTEQIVKTPSSSFTAKNTIGIYGKNALEGVYVNFSWGGTDAISVKSGKTTFDVSSTERVVLTIPNDLLENLMSDTRYCVKSSCLALLKVIQLQKEGDSNSEKKRTAPLNPKLLLLAICGIFEGQTKLLQGKNATKKAPVLARVAGKCFGKFDWSEAKKYLNDIAGDDIFGKVTCLPIPDPVVKAVQNIEKPRLTADENVQLGVRTVVRDGLVKKGIEKTKATFIAKKLRPDNTDDDKNQVVDAITNTFKGDDDISISLDFLNNLNYESSDEDSSSSEDSL